MGVDQIPNSPIRPDYCCSPQPCGKRVCWAPPEFTFDFCCQQPACRPAIVASIQRAFVHLVRTPGENMSLAVLRAAPLAFKAVYEGLRGLKLNLLDDLQACSCAFAYVTAIFLKRGGGSGEAASRLISPSWFTYGFSWGDAFGQGWGAMFALLAEPDRTADLVTQKEVLGATGSGLHSSNEERARFWDAAQDEARKLYEAVAQEDDSFPAFVAAAQKAGLWSRLWHAVYSDIAWRQVGRKCVAIPTEEGLGKWVDCSPWEYSPNANFSSPRPGAGAREGAKVAVCVLGAPRNVVSTYGRLRENLVNAVKGDAFVYVPFPEVLNEVPLPACGRTQSETRHHLTKPVP